MLQLGYRRCLSLSSINLCALFVSFISIVPLKTTACNLHIIVGPQLWRQDFTKALQIFTPVLLVWLGQSLTSSQLLVLCWALYLWPKQCWQDSKGCFNSCWAVLAQHQGLIWPWSWEGTHLGQLKVQWSPNTEMPGRCPKWVSQMATSEWVVTLHYAGSLLSIIFSIWKKAVGQWLEGYTSTA